MKNLTAKSDRLQFCYQQGWDDAKVGLIGGRYAAGTRDSVAYKHGYYDSQCAIAKKVERLKYVFRLSD